LLKSAAPHLGKDLDAMRATATALKERSLEMFKTALKDYTERKCLDVLHYSASICRSSMQSSTSICRSLSLLPRHVDSPPVELQQDPLIRSHLSLLYDTLLEQNLVRVIEPYSSVELSWIAQEVGQSLQVVEEK
jgi:26S proteasome regulatory subunit N6